ncbi:hypothetical protein BDZ91DRAFT_720062, partial [Kalaharituber pfeilii]
MYFVCLFVCLLLFLVCCLLEEICHQGLSIEEALPPLSLDSPRNNLYSTQVVYSFQYIYLSVRYSADCLCLCLL